MAPLDVPLVGDNVYFLSPAFRVYDDFPHGVTVRPHVAFLDWRNLYAVEDVRQAVVADYRRQRGRRGPRTRSDEVLVGVQLRSTNGTLVWTVFSKGERPRMEIFDPETVLL